VKIAAEKLTELLRAFLERFRRNHMSRGVPSLTALLGVLAVAGYQNRNKLTELLGGFTSGAAATPGTGSFPATQGREGEPGEVHKDGSIGAVLTDGLRSLVDRFREAGHGETADSWVAQGPNRDVAPQHIEGAIGSDMLDALSKQTGLSREEIIARLTKELPNAVDKYTPEGRIPA
jgi:uncharacterized protein YidB (DUF937 family)